jgi:hypothetical protein
MCITRYNDFLAENNNKIPVLDYLKNNLDGYFYISSGEKINIEITKENHKIAIRVMNSLKFRYGYYITSMIYDIGQSSEPDETKEFDKDLKNNIEYTFIDTVFEEGDVPYTIMFEPKYSSVPDIIPDVLYHITERDLVPRIKKYGLLPKAGNRITLHPKRIYLALSEKDAYDLLGNGKFWVDYATVLTIDISSVKDNIKFYTDLNYPGGVYTDSKIPVSCIKKYEL